MDAFLLDYNGVVVDDEPLHYAAFREVLAEEGIALDRPTYDALYLGIDDRAAFRLALRASGAGVEPERISRLVAQKAARYADLAARHLPLVPGVGSFVRSAAEHARVAVVSGAPRGEIALGLERAGITDAVESVVSAEDVALSKPDPAGYRLALSRLAGGAGMRSGCRAVVVEDSLPGLGAARALGAGCAMLATSHPAERLAAADLVWTSFDGHLPDELLPLLREVEVR